MPSLHQAIIDLSGFSDAFEKLGPLTRQLLDYRWTAQVAISVEDPRQGSCDSF